MGRWMQIIVIASRCNRRGNLWCASQIRNSKFRKRNDTQVVPYNIYQFKLIVIASQCPHWRGNPLSSREGRAIGPPLRSCTVGCVGAISDRPRAAHSRPYIVYCWKLQGPKPTSAQTQPLRAGTHIGVAIRLSGAQRTETARGIVQLYRKNRQEI